MTARERAARERVENTCNCHASSAVVCWMVRHGERPGRAPRCQCSCHQVRSTMPLIRVTREEVRRGILNADR